MIDADEEGESEDEALFLDTKTRKPAKKRPSEDGNLTNSKVERAAKLRKMMDSDDEKEHIPGNSEGKKEEANNEEADVAWSDSDSGKPNPPKTEEISAKEELGTTST